MKTNWQAKKLAEIASIVKGRKPKVFSNTGNMPYLTARAIRGFEDFEFVPEKQLENCVIVKEDDIVIIMDGSNSGELFGGLNGVLASTMGVIKMERETVDSRYLMHFLLTHRDAFTKSRTGSAIPHLNKIQFDNLEIPLPSLSEQKRIVKILDDAFEKLEKAKENTEKNLQNSKELFESYLSDIFSNPGKDWEEKTLKEVCEKITDGTHQTPTYFDDGYIFLSSKNVTSGKIDWDNVRYIDKKQHLEMQKRVSPKRNDILLAKNGTTGVAAIVDKDEVFDIYVSLAHIRTLDFVDPHFMLYFVNSPVAKRQFNKRLKGSGVPNLHLEEIREVIIVFPKSLQEQKQIVKKLDQLSEKTQRLESLYKQKLENIEELKKSILQKAFSGGL